MTDKKFSPAPWRLANDGLYSTSSRRVIKDAKGRSLIIVDNWTKEPDAVLMTAAPELYEALLADLKEFEQLQEHWNCEPAMKRIRAVLARARGEKP